MKLKLITDHDEFLDSVLGSVRMAVDPHIVDGKTRWLELFPEGNVPPYEPE